MAALALLGGALLGGAALGGCTSPFTAPDPSHVDSVDQAGTVRVVPATVALWEESSAAMKPNFALTGDQALAKVLPTTESIDQEVLSAVGAGLAVGFPQTTFNNTAGTTSSQQNASSTAGGVTTTTASTGTGNTATTTTQTQSGTPPALPTGTPAGGALPAAPGTAPALGLDPVLQYKAANHLLQEVQLLNQEIDDAANRKCFVPYIVGVKIAVINYRPKLAYSLHEHIGFFFKSRISNTQIDIRSGDAAFVGKGDPSPPPPSPDLAVSCRVSDLEPEAIPLLVTDDVQVAIKSRAAEAAHQISAALSFMVHGVGVGANLDALNQGLQSIQNHDLTSSMTVGRDTGSSIYVEVTPNNSASGDYSLVNQTYDVPVLLLIPRSYFGGAHDVSPVQLSVASYQQLRDATSGTILPGRSNQTLVEQGSAIIEPYFQTQDEREAWHELPYDQKLPIIKQLYGDVASGSMADLTSDLKNFKKIACNPTPCIAPTQGPNLWTALGTLGDDGNAASSVLQLPLPASITLSSQQVLLSDDGNNPVQAVLGGVSGRSVSKVAAQMRLTPYDAKAGRGAEVDVPAQSMTLDTTAHTLTLSFPSLKKLGIACLSPTELEPLPPTKPGKPGKPGKPAAGKDGAKPADKDTADASAAAPDDCPARKTGPGSDKYPNRIVLSLAGCDPRMQLCPELSLTDTAFDSTLAQDQAEREKSESLFDQARADVQANDRANQTIADALAQLKEATDQAKDAKSAPDLKSAQARLEQAVEALKLADTAQNDLLDQLKSAAMIDRLSFTPKPVSLLGVTLLKSSKATNPSKLKLAAGGTSVCLQNAPLGSGTIALTVAETPQGDSGAITVDGAAVASTLDSVTGIPMPPTKNGYTFAKAGTFTIGLINMTENSTVNVAVQAYNGTKPDGDAVKTSYTASRHCAPELALQH